MIVSYTAAGWEVIYQLGLPHQILYICLQCLETQVRH